MPWSLPSVSVVVSLVERNELFALRKDIRLHRYDELWEQHYFPIRDGEAPPREQMRVIFDTIEAAVVSGNKVFLHCFGGRGRSGCVAGCGLARAGIALGTTALNRLTEIRYSHGLFLPSPETARQRDLVIDWAPGE